MLTNFFKSWRDLPLSLHLLHGAAALTVGGCLTAFLIMSLPATWPLWGVLTLAISVGVASAAVLSFSVGMLVAKVTAAFLRFSNSDDQGWLGHTTLSGLITGALLGLAIGLVAPSVLPLWATLSIGLLGGAVAGSTLTSSVWLIVTLLPFRAILDVCFSPLLFLRNTVRSYRRDRWVARLKRVAPNLEVSLELSDTRLKDLMQACDTWEALERGESPEPLVYGNRLLTSPLLVSGGKIKIYEYGTLEVRSDPHGVLRGGFEAHSKIVAIWAKQADKRACLKLLCEARDTARDWLCIDYVYDKFIGGEREITESLLQGVEYQTCLNFKNKVLTAMIDDAEYPEVTFEVVKTLSKEKAKILTDPKLQSLWKGSASVMTLDEVLALPSGIWPVPNLVANLSNTKFVELILSEEPHCSAVTLALASELSPEQVENFCSPEVRGLWKAGIFTTNDIKGFPKGGGARLVKYPNLWKGSDGEAGLFPAMAICDMRDDECMLLHSNPELYRFIRAGLVDVAAVRRMTGFRYTYKEKLPMRGFAQMSVNEIRAVVGERVLSANEAAALASDAYQYVINEVLTVEQFFVIAGKNSLFLEDNYVPLWHGGEDEKIFSIEDMLILPTEILSLAGGFQRTLPSLVREGQCDIDMLLKLYQKDPRYFSVHMNRHYSKVWAHRLPTLTPQQMLDLDAGLIDFIAGNSDVQYALRHNLPGVTLERLQGLAVEARAGFLQHLGPIVAAHRERVGREVAAQEQNLFGGAQTTHRASVHITASVSALNLKALYGERLQRERETILKEIKEYLNGMAPEAVRQEQKNKFGAAWRCLHTRILNPRYAHTDPDSKVSNEDAVILFWLSIHDDNKCVGQLADRREALIDALYDIQRNYNFDKGSFEDRGGADDPACMSGTFNKLFECLSSVRKDVISASKDTKIACFDLKRMVRDAVLEHVRGLPSKNQIAAIDDLRENDLAREEEIGGPIWIAVKDRVAQQFFDSYLEAYYPALMTLSDLDPAQKAAKEGLMTALRDCFFIKEESGALCLPDRQPERLPDAVCAALAACQDHFFESYRSTNKGPLLAALQAMHQVMSRGYFLEMEWDLIEVDLPHIIKRLKPQVADDESSLVRVVAAEAFKLYGAAYYRQKTGGKPTADAWAETKPVVAAQLFDSAGDFRDLLPQEWEAFAETVKTACRQYQAQTHDSDEASTSGYVDDVELPIPTPVEVAGTAEHKPLSKDDAAERRAKCLATAEHRERRSTERHLRGATFT